MRSQTAEDRQTLRVPRIGRVLPAGQQSAPAANMHCVSKRRVNLSSTANPERLAADRGLPETLPPRASGPIYTDPTAYTGYQMWTGCVNPPSGFSGRKRQFVTLGGPLDRKTAGQVGPSLTRAIAAGRCRPDRRHCGANVSGHRLSHPARAVMSFGHRRPVGIRQAGRASSDHPTPQKAPLSRLTVRLDRRGVRQCSPDRAPDHRRRTGRDRGAGRRRTRRKTGSSRQGPQANDRADLRQKPSRGCRFIPR